MSMRADKELLKILTFATLGAFALERAIFYIFLTEHHYTPSTISLLQALFFVSIFLFEIPTGIFGDYFGKKLAEGLSLAAAMAMGPLVKNLLDWEGVFYLSSMASFLALLAILTFNPHDHVTPHAIAETTRPRTMSFFSASQHTMRAAMPVSLMHACLYDASLH